MKPKFTLLNFLAVFLLFMILTAGHSVAADRLIQVLETGSIDWSTGTVTGNGRGVPSARSDGEPSDSPEDILDAARLAAQANLIETLKAIRINAVSRVADRVILSSDFLYGLKALARNAVVTRQEYLSDGTLNIVITMTLTGGFGQYVLPEEIRQVDSVTTTANTETVAESDKSSVGDDDGKPYTGLVIDASGIGAKPSMVPVVYDESGEVVYGPAFVSREFAVSRGMSGFGTTLAAAREDKRVGDKPLIIKAIRTRTTGETDMVISSADALRLRSSVVHLSFLKACRVHIVMDPESHP